MKNINLTHSDTPSREELLNLLSNHFEPFGYKCSLFGCGPGRSIMVKKNAFKEARIYIYSEKAKITIKGSPGIPWLVGLPFLLLIGQIFSIYQGITNETYNFLSETLIPKK